MSRAGLTICGKAAGSRVQEGPPKNGSGWWLMNQSNCRAECELGGCGGHAYPGLVGEDTAERVVSAPTCSPGLIWIYVSGNVGQEMGTRALRPTDGTNWHWKPGM